MLDKKVVELLNQQVNKEFYFLNSWKLGSTSGICFSVSLIREQNFSLLWYGKTDGLF